MPKWFHPRVFSRGKIQSISSTEPAQGPRIALLIPGHNEELMIQGTILSAIRAGQHRSHIYMVNDASSDRTAALARRILGPDHVLSVRRSGKAKAIKKAVTKFGLSKRYDWIHISDADGRFAEDYFQKLSKHLNSNRFVAMTARIQSLKGSWVSKYRVYEYMLGFEVIRRIQSTLGVITVIPGPTACFSTKIFDQIDFQVESLTEDFDITLQIHRQRLGKIGYAADAITYTQDPLTYSDFIAQVKRWNRGFWQGISRHKVGRRFSRLDLYIGYMIIESFVFLAQLIVLPITVIFAHRPDVAAIMFLSDVIWFLGYVAVAAVWYRRYDILTAFPLFLVLRLTAMTLFFAAFIEVILLRKFRTAAIGWETAGRRYRTPA